VSLQIAPDRRRVAAAIADRNGRVDIWKIDFSGGAPSRLTFDGNGYRTAWSPDGRSLLCTANSAVRIVEANGTGQSKQAYKTERPDYGSDWSPDGRYWLFADSSQETGFDLWFVPSTGDAKPQPYLKTPYNELDGQFSPDGKWIAYTSDESGRNEIYVVSFPENSAKFPVSNRGGNLPRWRRDLIAYRIN
jgi:Tol biopolymer transport system component